MWHVINARNVSEALPAGLRYLAAQGKVQNSRAGIVLQAPGPVVTVYSDPWECVLTSAVRDANPFFAIAEALWMLAGRDDAAFLTPYVKNFSQYAEDDGRIHGAYGARWRRTLELDQLPELVRMLKNNPSTRQAVLQMWDCCGSNDLFEGHRDRPCNTHAYFRMRDGKLDMTVCCRSNDALMGCLAAETPIKSPEGDTPIRNLAAQFKLGLKSYPVYAVDPATGDMAIKKCTRAWKTGVKPVIELVFDDGSTLRLTRDHKLYKKKTRRGLTSILSKVMLETPAGDLKVGDRIWAPWIDYGEDRARFKKNVLGNTSFDNTQLVYRAYDEFLRGPLPPGYQVHHDDEDVTNDRSSNLIRLTQSEHMRLHAKKRMAQLSPEERRNRATTASYAAKEKIASMGAEERGDLVRRQTLHCSSVMTEHWKGVSSEEKRNRAKKASDAAVRVVDPEKRSEAARRGSASRWADPEQRRRQSELMRRLNQENRLRANHKIVEIRELPPEDVYDFTVEDYHTALVGNGVMAHNCYGANAVHFAFLHQYVAVAVGVPSGDYAQFSHDFHVYERDVENLYRRAGGAVPAVHDMLRGPRCFVLMQQLADAVTDARPVYGEPALVTRPVTFLDDCENFCRWVTERLHDGRDVEEPPVVWSNEFISSVVVPALQAHAFHRRGEKMEALVCAEAVESPVHRVATEEGEGMRPDVTGIHPQTLDPRRVADIVRYHVWPRLCPQDVASHTWQLMRIMLALWPGCPRELLVHAMFHDLGEVATGDIPYPVKANNPAIRAAVDALDAAACRRMGETFLVPPVTLALPDVIGPGWPTEAFWKLCELTEMFEYALHEGNLGNRYAAALAQTCWAQMVRLRDDLSDYVDDPDVREILGRYDAYVRARIDYERDVAEGADRGL